MKTTLTIKYTDEKNKSQTITQSRLIYLLKKQCKD